MSNLVFVRLPVSTATERWRLNLITDESTVKIGEICFGGVWHAWHWRMRGIVAGTAPDEQQAIASMIQYINRLLLPTLPDLDKCCKDALLSGCLPN